MKKVLHFIKMVGVLCFGITTYGQVTYTYTGDVQTYLVPPGITTIHVEMAGGDGYGTLGEGGSLEAVIPVTPGETLNLYVGGAGGSTTGGYNGGGIPGANSTYGGGGGASDIRVAPYGLDDRIAVAGGGGGSGSNCGTWTAEGGHGGGLVAESGCLYSCSDCQYTGAGGTQVAGGIAGPTGHGSCGGNTNGSFGQGGNNTGSFGTGGGGGWYGGGSGCFEGAGGGSSYTHPDATDVIHTIGGNIGNGYIIITELCLGLDVTVSDYGICLGSPLTLSASSISGAEVNWDGGVENGVTFIPDEPGTYVFTATSEDEADCVFEAEILVNEYPTVTAAVTDDEICLGDAVVFSGGGAATYSWDMGVTDGTAFTPDDIGTVTYTVYGEDEIGCDGSATVDVTVNPVPEVDATASETELCEGETLIFSIIGDADSYEWDPADIVPGVPYAPADGVESFTLTGYFDATGCSSEDEVTITLNPTPNVTATAGDGVFCADENVVLAAGGDADIFTWDPTDLNPGIGTHTYTVTGIYDGIEGCPATASVEVNVVGVPDVTASVDNDAICLGQSITLNGSGASFYVWNPDGVIDGVPYIPETIGEHEFTVTGEDSFGCTDDATIVVTVAEPVVLSYTTTPVVEGGDGSIDLTVSGGVTPYSFDWDIDGTGDFDDSEDLTGLDYGAYTVEVMGASGCIDKITVHVATQASIETNPLINSVTVYPNPTANILNIEATGLFTYTLSDISGAIILQGIGNEIETISMENLAKGSYFVQVKVENDTKTLKVIKN